MTTVDEQAGMLHVDVADERARLASGLHKRSDLAEWASSHGMIVRGSLNKRDLAWHMAQHGLIGPEGHLRSGFPRHGCNPPCADFPLCRHRNPNAPAWVDRHGDVWVLGSDGLLWTVETKPFPRETVERKWGPLRPRRKATAGR